MITLFRNFAKSKWAIGLIVLLGVGLLVTGGQQMDVIGALSPPKVVSAGSRSLDQNQFRQVVEQVRYQQQQENGHSPAMEELVADPGFFAAFRQRAQQLALMAWAQDAGIRPGRELVLREIRKIPAFFDPVTRQFDENAYKAKLGEVRMTPAMVEEQTRDQYVLVHYGTALEAGVRLPRIYGSVIANQTRQSRDGRWFTLTQAMAGTAPAPTEAQLSDLLRRNADQWRRPELRRGSVIVFANPADGQGEISDQRIQERFDFRRDSLVQPERRSFVTITAPSRQVADRVATALRAGQTPAAAASANNLQPATYNETPRSAVSDPAVAAAVFGLQPEQVSDPVQARVGFVVARVSAITPGNNVTLDTVRPQIVAELREADAKAKIFQRVEAYEAARRQGRTAEQAVQQVGARFLPLPALTREGRTAQGQQVNVPAPMLEALWKLSRGGVSDVASLEQSQYYAVRLDEVSPASMPTVEQVRPALVQDFTARENARLMTTRADALTARLRRNEDIAAVAASVGAPLTTQTGVGQTQEAAQALGQAAVVGLFGAQPGQAFSQPSPEGGIVIGRLDRIVAPAPAIAAPEALSWRQRMSASTGQPFLQAVLEAAARKLKAGFDEARARTALGLTEAPPAGAAPAKK